MIESICLAAMLFANLWATDSFNPEQNCLQGAAIIPEVPKAGDRVPIVGPLKPKDCSTCAAPDRAEILRALPRGARGVPYVCEEFRNDIEVKVEKLVDRVDPPRFFPLIGPAQLHHCHWKCTVYFTDVTEGSYPWPFRVQKRRAEVVYIDKDHLHLCADPSADASPNASPGNCAGGRFRGKEASNSTVKSNPEIERIASPSNGGEKDQQVQLEFVVAQVKNSALPLIPFPWAESQKGSAAKSSVGVLKNHEKLLGLLQTLRSNGLAKILAEPRVTTLSGRSGSIISGREVPVMTFDGPGAPSVTYKTIGTEIRFLPIVKANGKIHLEVCSEVSAINPGAGVADAGVVAPGFKVRSATVVVQIEDGQTLAIGGLTLNEEEEMVMLVTARVVHPKQANAPPPDQIPPIEECPRPLSRLRQAKADSEQESRGRDRWAIPDDSPRVGPPSGNVHRPMTIDDVVNMSQKGVSGRIILRQIELTNAVFNLSADDIIRLHEEGVSDDIIGAMQERRTGSTIGQPRRPEVLNVLPPAPPVYVEPTLRTGIRGRF
jgi:hypothetical protein